jgi:group I intron endonuclease
MGVIYLIRNTKNNGGYLGSSKNFLKRKRRHLRDLRLGVHHSIYLQRSYEKHGEACFVFEILEECGESDLFSRERFWMDRLKPKYNVGAVGGGDNYSNHPNKEALRKALSSHLRNCKRARKYGAENSNWRGGVSTFTCPYCGKSRPAGKIHPKSCIKCRKFVGRKPYKPGENKPKIVSVNGVVYPSMLQAARATGEKYHTLRRKIMSTSVKEYYFV